MKHSFSERSLFFRQLGNSQFHSLIMKAINHRLVCGVVRVRVQSRKDQTQIFSGNTGAEQRGPGNVLHRKPPNREKLMPLYTWRLCFEEPDLLGKSVRVFEALGQLKTGERRLTGTSLKGYCE